MNSPQLAAAPPSALARDFQNVITDAQELLQTLGTEGGARLDAVKGRVQVSLEAAAERLAEMQRTVAHGAKAAAHSTDDYVRANPWQAVGIGAAAGLLAGFLLCRR